MLLLKFETVECKKGRNNISLFIFLIVNLFLKSILDFDFFQGCIKKGIRKCVNERLGETVSLMPGVIGARLSLQKSISTPSIVTPPGPTYLADSRTSMTPSLTR